jgi:hypothetical protein
MARNIVILSPHFPPHYHRFWRQVREAGGNALGIGDAPYEALSDETRAALNEYYRVPDMHDYDGLVRACGYYTHRHGRIERFDSLNEYWLATEARIRDDFNIPGIRTSEIEFVRCKSRMKERFAAAGVPVPRAERVRTLEEARARAREIGYPLVAKPDAGVGALNTYRIDTDTDLARVFATTPPVDYLLEEFVTGEIHSFDGLADASGAPVFVTSHVFSQGIMETVNDRRHLFYYSQREIPAPLEAAGRACLAAFGVRERFFHIEFFLTPSGEYVGLEVNLRPPGGWTTDMFNYACDTDVYKAWAELLVLGDTRPAAERKYHCCYVSRRRSISYAHTHNDVLARYGHLILQVENVPEVLSGALGDVGFIFRNPDLERMLEVVRFIHATA